MNGENIKQIGTTINGKISFSKVGLLAKRLLNKDGKIMCPTIILELSDGLVVNPIPWDCEDAKKVSSKIIRNLLSATGIDEYYFFAETWFVKNKEGDSPLRGAPSDSPEKKEALLIGFYRKDRNGKMRMIPFHKEDNKIVFERATNFGMEGVSGRFDFFLEGDSGDD